MGVDVTGNIMEPGHDQCCRRLVRVTVTIVTAFGRDNGRHSLLIAVVVVIGHRGLLHLDHAFKVYLRDANIIGSA